MYDIVVKGMILLICLCIAFKVSFVWIDEPAESFGVYPADVILQANET